MFRLIYGRRTKHLLKKYWRLPILFLWIQVLHRLILNLDINVEDDDNGSRINTAALAMTSPDELIEELIQVQLKVMSEEFGHYRKAVLFDMANMENKGDPAISVGELNFLSMLNVSLVDYCFYTCSHEYIESARQKMDETYNKDEVLVLSSGGGNFGGYRFNDMRRVALADQFHDYKYVILSQSTWFDADSETHLVFLKSVFSKHKRMILMLRDTMSYAFGRDHFQSIKPLLAPDMAFGIGRVKRYMAPTMDVIWINRHDDERVGRVYPVFPPGISYKIMDWWGQWKSPQGQHFIDWTYMMTYNGLLFLQRGKVVVTDRLHGHILAALLDIPTVIIDTKMRKISKLRNTWTKGLKKVVLAKDDKDAVRKALKLLQKYGNDHMVVPFGKNDTLKY